MKLPSLVILLFLHLCCFGQISFAPYSGAGVGSWPWVVDIGDLNNDSLNDVVLCTQSYSSPNDYKLFVFFQTPMGTLAPPVSYIYYVFNGIYSCDVEAIDIADMNNDGLSDVVIGFHDSIGIFYQNMAGTLNPVQSFYSGQSKLINGICTGYLDSDSLPDIAVCYRLGDHITVLHQTGGGLFNSVLYPSPPGELFDKIEIGDVNNDHLDDVLLTTQSAPGGCHIFLQNNNGTLENYYSRLPGDYWGGTNGVAVGDLNNDNLNDFVIDYGGNTPSGRIAVFYQDTASVSPFLQHHNSQAYDMPESIRIADLNCDNRNEIIIAHGGWHSVSVFEQDLNDNYHYNNYSLFTIPDASHFSPYGMSIGDINNDQLNDIVIANSNGSLVVLYNQSICCPLPLIPAIPAGPETVCDSNQSAWYTVQSPGIDSITWNLLPVAAGNIMYSVPDSCLIAWNSPWFGTAYLFRHAINNCGSVSSDTLLIIRNNLPVINLGNDTMLCMNAALELTVGDNFNTSYLWQDCSVDSVFTVVSGGIYHVTAQNECGIVSDTLRVTEVPLPVINLVEDTILCEDANIEFDVGLPGLNHYLWQDGATTPDYIVISPGIYSVTITDSNNCVNQDSTVVSYMFLPRLKFPSDTILCTGTSLILDATNGGCHYTWQDGSTCTVYVVLDSGQYSVTVTNICKTVTDSTYVELTDCNCRLDLPNTFTPNHDGLNDVLFAFGNNVKDFQFVIYSRWGEKVFETHDLSIGWDGTYKGEKMDTNMFVYFITARCNLDGHRIHKDGYILVLW